MRRLTPHNQAGFTLVELLVAMLLLGVVGGVVLRSVVQSMRLTSETTERTNALTDIQRGLERVSRQIRTADPLRIDPDGACDGLTGEVCQDTILSRRLDVDAYFDSTIHEYAYYLVDSGDSVELRQDVVRRDIDTGTVTSTSTGEFIADIANLEVGTGTPLFQFRWIDPVTGVLETIDCDGLSVDECRTRHTTASVVEITLQKLLRTGDVVSASTAVAIRNTRYEP